MKKAFLLLTVYFWASYACFGHEGNIEFPRWITVSGHGEISAPPDMAILRLGVLTTAKTAKLATELNNQLILQIFKALEAAEIPSDDFETSRFQLTPQREYRKGLSPLITGYQVTNSLIVRIYDLDRVGEIMQEAVDAGGNNFESLSFVVEDDQEFVEEARMQAMEDAFNKAKVLANTLDATVGEPITIQEISGHHRPGVERRMMQADAMMASVPVQAPSGLKTHVQVQVKFALE